MVDSTPARRSRKPKPAAKPKKPYADFPLRPHALGYWSAKFHGQYYNYGRWARVVDGVLTALPYEEGWQSALAAYKAHRDSDFAGRTRRTQEGELTVAGLCNHFLTAKKQKLDAGELSQRMFDEYQMTTDRLVAGFGKNRLVTDLAADDFAKLYSKLADQYGPTRRGNEVQKVRTVFKFAFEDGLIQSPVRFGTNFKKPSKKVMRLHKAANGEKTFTAEEVRRLLGCPPWAPTLAGTQMRAMILLGINAAFGNHDCGRLPLSALDLDAGWVRFARPKTGIPRRAKLWPETVALLREALADRPEPKDKADAGLVFMTKYGKPWSADGSAHAVSLQFGKLLRRLHINGRVGLGFYSLRHTFRTVADATKDANAIRLVMGHTDDSIDANYTHSIDDERVEAVADHVHQWVFGKQSADDLRKSGGTT